MRSTPPRWCPIPQLDLILASGETATLTVRDNGHGIEDLDALFEPFYTTKQPGDGVGLGLAISSGIVNDLGGRLTATECRRRRGCFRDPAAYTCRRRH